MSSPPAVRPSRAGSARPSRPGRRRRPSLLSGIGILLLAAGLGCLGWVAYQLWGTNVVSEKEFQQQTSQLRHQWEDRPGGGPGKDTAESAPLPGNAIALLRIPRFGAGYEVPIVQGTDASDLARGVGHYPATAAPGAVGNFAVAGHRITHGQPFSRLLELQAGDTVVVETRTAVFTYRLDTAPRDLTVEEDDNWVLDPVPGKPTATPSEKLITLTTCQDLFHSPDRSVAFGTLVGTEAK